MNIDIYTHCFIVSNYQEHQEKYIQNHLKGFQEYEVLKDARTGFIHKELKANYFYIDADNYSYHFHITFLEEFLNLTKGYNPTIKRHYYNITQAKDINLKTIHLHPPRDYQRKIIEDAIKTDANNLAITLQAGGGKTLVAKYLMKHYNKRTLCTMRGGYIERWVPDLEESFQFEAGQIAIVRGRQNLINLMVDITNGDTDPQVILVPIETLTNYIKEYQELTHTRTKGTIAPIDLFKKLGIGLVILDEGHQNPHRVMRLFSHTHVPKFITLSATLETTETFRNNIYKMMYPEEYRLNGGYKNIYIGVNSLTYSTENLQRLRFKGYMGSYSHTTFETSLLKLRYLTNKYLGLVKYSIDLLFMNDYQKGTKCMVFFGTIKMCTIATQYLQEKYPNLRVGRYTSNDKMDVLDNNDIIVSTVLSAGTAVDIPNLRTTIMSTVINSKISNEQTLYRTRPLKDYPDITPTFNYFVCRDIEKHLHYHYSKQQFFKGKVKYHSNIDLPYGI